MTPKHLRTVGLCGSLALLCIGAALALGLGWSLMLVGGVGTLSCLGAPR